MSLTEKQIRHLRRLAHPLKPVVMIGARGLSEGVKREIDLSLAHHELIKIRVAADGREERRRMIETACAEADAELVQAIGHVAVLYRPAEKPVIQLPPR
ncbi:MAG TPA: ribosome assembly RNA-binding protein YhbY [Thiotrichales bacterium]|nr:ribosome assembly RNA-binding protein YhbY [Thiotrichales bacterium]